MKKAFLVAIFVFAAASFGILSAQSRQPATTNGQKANKRPAETPKPTPTPTPSENIQAGILEPLTDDEVIKVDTNLVTIPVKVSDRNGRLIAGLKKENFKIFEDSVEQEVTYFSNEEQPFTVALILDMSYSSKFKIAEIQAAANAFVAQLRPADKVMVVSFDSEIHILTEPTNNRERLRNAIKQTQIATGTSLYEAIDVVVNEKLKKIEGRKAIVLFTDGVDTSSMKADSNKNLRDVYELDSLIYPIEYDTYSDVQKVKNNPSVIKSPIPSSTPNPLPFPLPSIGTPSNKGTTPEEYRLADEYLNELANRTGGRLYQADTIYNLATAFTNIANELRQTYSLGFYPNDEKKGKKRQLKVRVNQKGYVVRARDSYVINQSEKKSGAK
jgi:Ca-activated chloride channel homolog